MHTAEMKPTKGKEQLTQRAVQSNAKADQIVVRSIDIRGSGRFVAEA